MEVEGRLADSHQDFHFGRQTQVGGIHFSKVIWQGDSFS